ncbi:MAG TPA: hypothetical protein VG322_14370 [Candidatus Acidoferrales bacterium]|jgi:hypothetical protein|nr:hypothetical protein [Candidatus Acidoferrales bacterium]
MRTVGAISFAARCAAIFALAVCSAAAQQPAAKAPGPQAGPPNLKVIQRPPLFFREDWKPMVNPKGNGEHTVAPQDLSSADLELKLYGDQNGPKEVFMGDDQSTVIWTGLCASNCAVALRNKNSYVDLSGAAKIRWRTRQSGFHILHPIVKLADGTWLVAEHGEPSNPDWIETDVPLAGMRWRRLDIQGVVEGRDGQWVENPDLSKVDEVGFTDLMAGSGHGAGGSSRVDWIEVYGNAVPREGGEQKSSSGN